MKVEIENVVLEIFGKCKYDKYSSVELDSELLARVWQETMTYNLFKEFLHDRIQENFKCDSWKLTRLYVTLTLECDQKDSPVIQICFYRERNSKEALCDFNFLFSTDKEYESLTERIKNLVLEEKKQRIIVGLTWFISLVLWLVLMISTAFYLSK